MKKPGRSRVDSGMQVSKTLRSSATPAALLDSPDDRLGVLVGRRSQPHSSSKVYRTGHVHRFSEERLVRSHGRGLLLHYSRRSSGLDDCGSMCALGSTAANGRCSVWNKTCVIAIILQALWSLGRTAAVRAKSVGAPLRSNQMSIMNGTVAKRGIENRQVAPFLPSSTLLHIIDGLSNPRAIMPANADH